VLALNGADDAGAPPDVRAAFEAEMRDGKVDWASVDFGGAVHCFTEKEATHYVSAYWTLAMIGRFAGSAIMTRFSPRVLLTLFAGINVTLLALTMLSQGQVALYSIVAVGLFNSIMFPTIFALSIERLGTLTNKASSLLIMAIVGGAVVPYLQGLLADQIGLHESFILPLLCYGYIIFYGLSGSRPAVGFRQGA